MGSGNETTWGLGMRLQGSGNETTLGTGTTVWDWDYTVVWDWD